MFRSFFTPQPRRHSPFEGRFADENVRSTEQAMKKNVRPLRFRGDPQACASYPQNQNESSKYLAERVKKQNDEIRNLQRQLLRYENLLEKVENRRQDHNLHLLQSKRFWCVSMLLLLFVGIATKALITERYNAQRYDELYEILREKFPDLDLEAPLTVKPVMPIFTFWQWFSVFFGVFWEMASSFFWRLFWSAFRIFFVCGAIVVCAVLVFGRIPWVGKWVSGAVLAVPMPRRKP